jgi:3-oxoacyl-[acyl-carrier protein] reductase
VSLLTGKRAFVTGGTRGIGAAICDIFAREGADVAFNYGSRDDLAEEVRGKIESHGRQAISFKVSVTDRLGLKRIVKEVVGKWGGLDILINNAAINRPDSFATTTDHAWDEVINTNVGSLFAVTKPIYKQMIRQRKGSILNITSIAALRALPTAVHYATSKAAIIGFTKCLSREAATFGIRVNAIAAGVFDTDLAQILPQRLLELHNMWTPAGRVGRPEELAEYAAFMVSDRNTFMNGEVVVVDGGATT